MPMKTRRSGSRLFIIVRGLTLRNALLADIPIHSMRVGMEHRLQRQQQLHAPPFANTKCCAVIPTGAIAQQYAFFQLLAYFITHDNDSGKVNAYSALS